jgi:FO synthase
VWRERAARNPDQAARAEIEQIMMSVAPSAIERAALHPLADDAALALADLDQDQLDTRTEDLMAAAAQRRDAAWGAVVTFSPKVFLPLTNLCRNACDYCSFRRSPSQPGAWTMTPDEVEAWLARGRALGCVEALFCLGDTPESVFPSYRAALAGWGHGNTVDYLLWAGARALALDLLPHTNAGILSSAEMARLEAVNASLGLMLENVSPRLCEKGMPHHRAPDKRPEKRLAMLRAAGELRVPFTTGILIGIGETERERVESLLAIRALHRRHGHIQEVIVQPFRARPDIPMHDAEEPASRELSRAVALARLILDDETSVQAPPNLSTASTAALLASGLNDFGGISPVTPDYINPQHPWPHLDGLADACAAAGFTLEPRAPVYERFIDQPGFLAEPMRAHVRRISARLAPLRAALARPRAGASA